MVGVSLTSCHVLNIIPMGKEEKTPYEKWVGRKSSLSYLRTCGCMASLSYLRTCGCMAKVNVLINKKCKLRPRTVDCVFLGYALCSIAYRFLVVKSEAPDVYVKGKCALGPFLSILVIECQHKWTYVNLDKVMDKVQIK
jgi:hypothetical protein